MCDPGLYPAGYHRIRTRSGTIINTGKLGKLYKVLHPGKQCISIYKCPKLSFSPPGKRAVFSCPLVRMSPKTPSRTVARLRVFPENAIQLSSCNFAKVVQCLVLFFICAMIITEVFEKEQAIPWRVFFILSRRLCGVFAIICKDVDIKHQKNAVFHPFRRFLRATTWRINRKIIFRGASRIMRNHLMIAVSFLRITVRA